jgi:ATP-dependent Clp protease ATP-binding subunit ClpC
MFERYTEKARRVIFFARYEASQYGSPTIETEHILFGLLREDKALIKRFLRSRASVKAVKWEVNEHIVIRKKIPTKVDLPLTNGAKRVLAYACEEAQKLRHEHIGPEDLLLGLLREERSPASRVLAGHGLMLKHVREELARRPHRRELRPMLEKILGTVGLKLKRI